MFNCVGFCEEDKEFAKDIYSNNDKRVENMKAADIYILNFLNKYYFLNKIFIGQTEWVKRTCVSRIVDAALPVTFACLQQDLGY